ncbi:metallophosphoesterase family protein [Gelidibacter salicanalis]|uniref:Metallophosphoesterase family protein n=1 Tax=Gelidibacter salicanalis TaxID=291193 RepID=A0A934NJ29_9FLAO|nr:metallophosphoesterase family protein [Gelidibacter salicanalis]MBJ7880799.1 metallophosphoesterase family protein [Gelidibacter salicanalis]
MDKKIKNIGKISGKVLLFGGVYSNLQALQKIKSIAESKNIPPENCICTGDIVGYCAQPEETVQLFQNWGAQSIAGNVELQLRDGATDCGCDFKKGSRCDGFSQLWYPYAQNQLSKDALDFMATLPHHLQFEYADKQVTVVHGSYSNTSEFIFKSTPWNIKQTNFVETNCDVIIAGHCGLPFSDQNNNLLWLNPGVIGMPANDGIPKVWYAILDDSNTTLNFEQHTFEYDHERASKLMYEANLPEVYVKTLLTGLWDNTEILPATESTLQTSFTKDTH